MEVCGTCDDELELVEHRCSSCETPLCQECFEVTERDGMCEECFESD